jgi:phenylalanyl-tRNA synthetase beta subunit
MRQRFFEIGTVFPDAGVEEIHVAYANKKGLVESTLEEFTRELSVGDNQTPNTKKQKPFTPWSQYPFIVRDVAVWVPVGTNPDELIDLCKKEGTTLLVREPQLFDQFTKGDKTSLAIRLVFQSHERTLTDVEITNVMTEITQKIQARNWEVR